MAKNFKSITYVLTALLISCLISFTLAYTKLFSIPNLSFLHAPVSQARELSIHLHPAKHNLRKSQTINLRWNITQGYRSPDGVQKLVYLINDEFPGPTIEARSGDSLDIEVFNSLPGEGVSFHWHGLHMKGTNGMDGVVGVTQSAIMPGTSFKYKFQISESQAGTFWYHSHSETQRADGLFGGFIVHGFKGNTVQASKPLYGDDIILLIGDWYHRSAEEVQASYVTHANWGREPVPDSLLVNGLGAFNCSMAVASRPLNCANVTQPVLTLRNKRTRVRVVNVGAMSGLSLTVPNHRMTIFEVDGGNKISKAPPSSILGILYPGERIDMVLEWAGANELAAELTVTLDDENYNIQNKALTIAHHFPVKNVQSRKTRRGHSFEPDPISNIKGFLDISLQNGTTLSTDVLPMLADQTILIYTKIEVLAHLGNVPAGFMNRTSWAPQSSPTIPLIDLARDQWDKNQLVPWIPISRNALKGKWVDIVVNNLDEKGHPFHLHGYDFYVLKSYTPTRRGYHAFNPFSPLTPPSSPDLEGGSYNLINPRKKDTIYVPSQGYVVLRILADNVGIWFFHCHILWHSGAGMAMALEIGYED